MRKNTACTLLIGLLGLGLCGCRQEVTESAEDGGKPSYTFGLVAKANNNPVFPVARRGAEDAAKALGEKHGVNIKIDWRTPDTEDAQQQASNIEQLMLAGVDGISISCSDATVVTKPINEAVEAGIPVMCFDSDAADSKRFVFHGVDDHECGRRVMEELAKAMDGKGVVAVLAGNQNAPNLRIRAQGVIDEAEKYPGITIKDIYYHEEDTQSAAAKVEEVQDANPDITGWAMIGGWAIFSDAIRKKEAFADGDVKIVSIDALPESLPYIHEDIAPVLLAQQIYQWGWRSVEILLDKTHFEKNPPAEKDIADLEAITKENVDEYAKRWEKWMPGD